MNTATLFPGERLLQTLEIAAREGYPQGWALPTISPCSRHIRWAAPVLSS